MNRDLILTMVLAVGMAAFAGAAVASPADADLAAVASTKGSQSVVVASDDSWWLIDGSVDDSKGDDKSGGDNDHGSSHDDSHGSDHDSGSDHDGGSDHDSGSDD